MDDMFSDPFGKSLQCPANEEDCLEMMRKDVSCILWNFLIFPILFQDMLDLAIALAVNTFAIMLYRSPLLNN